MRRSGKAEGFNNLVKCLQAGGSIKIQIAGTALKRYVCIAPITLYIFKEIM